MGIHHMVSVLFDESVSVRGSAHVSQSTGEIVAVLSLNGSGLTLHLDTLANLDRVAFELARLRADWVALAAEQDAANSDQPSLIDDLAEANVAGAVAS